MFAVGIIFRFEVRKCSHATDYFNLRFRTESGYPSGHDIPPSDGGSTRPGQASRLPELIVERCDARRMYVVAHHGGFL